MLNNLTSYIYLKHLMEKKIELPRYPFGIIVNIAKYLPTKNLSLGPLLFLFNCYFRNTKISKTSNEFLFHVFFMLYQWKMREDFPTRYAFLTDGNAPSLEEDALQNNYNMLWSFWRLEYTTANRIVQRCKRSMRKNPNNLSPKQQALQRLTLDRILKNDLSSLENITIYLPLEFYTLYSTHNISWANQETLFWIAAYFKNLKALNLLYSAFKIEIGRLNIDKPTKVGMQIDHHLAYWRDFNPNRYALNIETMGSTDKIKWCIYAGIIGDEKCLKFFFRQFL